MIRRASSLGLAALLLAVPAAAGAAVSPRTPPTPRPVPPVLPVSPAACARPPGAAPSQALLGALGVLRRPAQAQDALPETVQRLLKARGLAPVDAASVRLLRSTPDGGKAWIVPEPCVPGASAGEGVVVVATGGAPAGGGAPLPDLVRGRGAVSVDACAGPGHDMLGVSGVVPDGVAAAYLTAPDGTAVRADVSDNGYAFVVPTPRDPGQRYVVWTGGDGTPHVQPVPRLLLRPGRSACATRYASVVRITPEPNGCRVGAIVVAPPVATVPRAPSRRRARPVPMPVPVVTPAVPVAPCAAVLVP